MFYLFPPPDGPDLLRGHEASTIPALSRRRRTRITRRAARLREVRLPARLASAQHHPRNGRASAAYLRALDDLWELERSLAGAPASDET